MSEQQISNQHQQNTSFSKNLAEVAKPRVVTSELVLRTLEDFHARELFLLTDKNRTYLRQWLPWLDSCTTETDTSDFINSKQDALSKNNGLTYGIFYNNVIAGTISFNEINRLENKAEIGYWIGENFQGHGLVTKACSELVNLGFNELGLSEISIGCALGNNKSQGIPIRLDFTKTAIVPRRENLYGTYVDHVIYATYPDQWNQLQKEQ